MRNKYTLQDREFLSAEERMRARIRSAFIPADRRFTPQQTRQIEDKVLALVKLYAADPRYTESRIHALEQELEFLLHGEDAPQLRLRSELRGQ